VHYNVVMKYFKQLILILYTIILQNIANFFVIGHKMKIIVLICCLDRSH